MPQKAALKAYAVLAINQDAGTASAIFAIAFVQKARITDAIFIFGFVISKEAQETAVCAIGIPLLQSGHKIECLICVSILQQARKDIFAMIGVILVQDAKRDTFNVFGVTAWQDAERDTFIFFGLALIQSADNCAFIFLGITLWQSAKCSIMFIGLVLWQTAIEKASCLIGISCRQNAGTQARIGIGISLHQVSVDHGYSVKDAYAIIEQESSD